jgi:hypothetical protein
MLAIDYWAGKGRRACAREEKATLGRGELLDGPWRSSIKSTFEVPRTCLERESGHTLAPWSLAFGDRLDDELAAFFGAEGTLRAGDGQVEESVDVGVFEWLGVFEADVADGRACAFQKFLGIGNALALEEEEGDPLGIEGDREDGFGGLFGGAETDHEAVVVVVDHLDGAGHEGAELFERDAGELCDLGIVFGQVEIKLFGRREVVHGR